MLGSRYDNLRSAAARALGATGNPNATGPLVAAIKWQTEASVVDMVRALAALQDEKAINPLIRLYNRCNDVYFRDKRFKDELHTEICSALKGIGPPAINRLIADLSVTEAATPRRWIEIFPEIEGAEIFIGARKIIRTNAADLLGYIGDDTCIDALVNTLGSDIGSARALGRIGGSALEAVLQAYGSADARGNRSRRTAAVLALVHFDEPRAEEIVVRWLSEGGSPARKAIAAELDVAERFNDPAMFEAVAQAVSAKDYPVVAGAYKSIYYNRSNFSTPEEEVDSILCEALFQADSLEMAEYFLNHGTPKMRTEAGRWARAKGFVIN
jgi:HEAT repeat protein